MRRHAEFKTRNDPLNRWLNLQPSRMVGFKKISLACGGIVWQTAQKWASKCQVPDRYVPAVSALTGIPPEHLSPNAARLIAMELNLAAQRERERTERAQGAAAFWE